MTTIDFLQAELSKFYAAREKILAAQSYGLNGQSVTRTSLAEVNKEIARLETSIARRQRGGSAVKAPLFGA